MEEIALENQQNYCDSNMLRRSVISVENVQLDTTHQNLPKERMNKMNNNEKINRDIRLDDYLSKNQSKCIPPPLEISTSRKHSMDYFTKDGFILRTGYSDKLDWYLLPIKEGLDNSIDFNWKYSRGENAYVNVDVTKDDSLFCIRIRNSNPKNIPVFQDLNGIFRYDLRYGSKQHVHTISRGMLGDAMKQILSIGYILTHVNDDGTEFEEKQWEYPLIIRHNKQEWKIYLLCNKAKQEYEVKLKKSPEKLTHTDTEIELVLPIIYEVRNTLDRSYIERFCREYSILTTDISFRFRIHVEDNNILAPQPQTHLLTVPYSNSSIANVEDHGLATQLVTALSKLLSKDVSNIEVPALHSIAAWEAWNNLDSIHSYLPEEFLSRITNVHDKELRTVYDVLRSFREGTNIKKNAKVQRAIASLLTSPNMYGEIAELYYQLKDALPPQRKLSLPYNTKCKERINALASRIGELYDIDKNKKPSYRIEHGYFYDGKIQYPYAFEILGIPLANPIQDVTKFIGAVNYSVSPKNIKFDGEYDVGGFEYEKEDSIDDILRVYGFHKNSPKKSRLPCIVIGNLITPRRDPHGYDKSRIDTSPFAETIVRAAKKMASKIQTLRAAGYIIHQKDDDYRNARQKMVNRTVSAKELLRQFLIKERGLPSNG